MRNNAKPSAVLVDLATKFLVTLIHAVGTGMVKFSNQKNLRFTSNKIKPLSTDKHIRKLMR